MKSDIWDKFIKYGSSFEIEGEKDNHDSSVIYYHLRMFGLIYPSGYEIVGKDINKLIKQAIKDGDNFINNN